MGAGPIARGAGEPGGALTRPRPPRSDTLDLMKCLAIYSVVFLHVRFPGSFGVAVNCLARFAVPLFFLSAGFFSWDSRPAVLLRRAVRTAGMLLFSCGALLVLSVLLARRHGQSAGGYVLSRFSWGNLRNLLLYQTVPLAYAWPLWFLVSLLGAYLLWAVLVRAARGRVPYDALAILSWALLAVHLALGEGRCLLGLSPAGSETIRNLWLDGMPLFLLGTWLGARRALWERCPTALLWGLALLGCPLALAERWAAGEFLDLHLGSLLTAVCVLAGSRRCSRVKSPLLRSTACLCGRELTFYIFAFHVSIDGILTQWEVPFLSRVASLPWLRPILVAALATLLALGLHRAALKKR